jgi:hypothetical protein
MPVRKSQILKFLMIIPQIRKFPWCLNLQIANLKGKSSVSDPNSIYLSPIFFFTCNVANQQIATFAEGPQIYKRIKSANFRICDLRNLFADRPPLGAQESVPWNRFLSSFNVYKFGLLI